VEKYHGVTESTEEKHEITGCSLFFLPMVFLPMVSLSVLRDSVVIF